jgi:hypothetical protein
MCDAEPDADQSITFELATAELQSGGATATLALLNADVFGVSHVVEFDSQDKANYSKEAEDGDLLATTTPACLEIISTGTGSLGNYIFCVTIRRG